MEFKSAIKYFLYSSLALAFIILLGSTVLWIIKHKVNNEFWTEENLNLCNNATADRKWMKNDSICLTFVHKFRPINIEIINWAPALVIYRNMLSEKQVSGFLETFKEQELISQRVQNRKGKGVPSKSRIANGSFLIHSHNNATLSVFNSAQYSIPSFNLSVAELFSGLSYFPGGFYAPHYDFIQNANDYWCKTFRNRVATLIFVFQTPEEGGGTVFPLLETTVRANVGDAFFWMNERSDESREHLSLHGGCPVYKGEKIISTLWIHAKGQPILSLANTDSPISAEWLIPGFANEIRSEIQNQCYWNFLK